MTIVKFFDVPFGSGGTTTVIPDGVQAGGEVSFTQGYGPDYSLAPATSGVLYPQSGEFNYLMNAITSALQMFQIHCFPDWISASVNGGSPYAYDANVAVRYTDGNIWISIVSGNTATPGTDPTKWQQFNFFPSLLPSGICVPYENIVLPDSASTSSTTTSGYIWPNGQTIGNASSNATGRANADTQTLYTITWNSYPNSVRQLYNSSGTPISRGGSAAADWAANNAITIRDMRDVVPAGLSTMGGTSDRGLLTGATSQGVNGAVLGSTGGEQAHTPQISEMASHTHVENAGDGGAMYPYASGSGNSTSPTGNHLLSPIQTQATGGGAAFNVVQPTTICNWIMKL
jgi:hypothetical protein